MKAPFTWLARVSMALIALHSAAQDAPTPRDFGPADLAETGQMMVDGKPMTYLIRRLPVNSFPELPEAVAAELNRRGCLIPQTYEAHHPENVVRARLEEASSLDWAVLCSKHGTVQLLVFFGSATPAAPVVLASAQEKDRLQVRVGRDTMGFNWGIDRAAPEQVHEAQAGMEPRPAWVKHDALADSVIDRKTVYHFYDKGAWTLLEMPN
jgi:hypothetical protein